MCRLFGLTAGTNRVKATFWLLDAPDSLEVQSHRNVDGAGLGYFGPDGEPVLDKQPVPAYRDEEFQRAARQAESTAFVAHVRWATAGGRAEHNTHPFGMNGRVMAHNGGFGSLAQLEAELGSYGRLVLGDTDSERYFALITKETDERGGDVGAGVAAAARLRRRCRQLALRRISDAPDGPLSIRLLPPRCTPGGYAGYGRSSLITARELAKSARATGGTCAGGTRETTTARSLTWQSLM